MSNFKKICVHRTAWLSFLLTESMEDAERLAEEYPWLEEIYRELAMLRQRPEEVLGMFSDALRIMDQNTVKYMIEEQQQVMKQQQKVMDDQRRELEKQKRNLLEKDQEYQTLKTKSDREYQALKTESDRKIQEQEARIRELEALLEQKQK